jgi:pimeloyl-ACP methyl ester carboxylesterase
MYLPGTSNWLPAGNGKAFDLKSNLELLGGEENTNSSRAAHAALSAYGGKPQDRIVLVGYSQGGILAASIAEQNLNVVGLVTIGAPVANAKLPENLPTLSIEHSNDVVPALAGETNPLTKNWATASRHVNIELGETALKAHEISNYAETARQVDHSNNAGLVRIREQILGNLDGAKALGVREFQPLKATAWP